MYALFLHQIQSTTASSTPTTADLLSLSSSALFYSIPSIYLLALFPVQHRKQPLDFSLPLQHYHHLFRPSRKFRASPINGADVNSNLGHLHSSGFCCPHCSCQAFWHRLGLKLKEEFEAAESPGDRSSLPSLYSFNHCCLNSASQAVSPHGPFIPCQFHRLQMDFEKSSIASILLTTITATISLSHPTASTAAVSFNLQVCITTAGSITTSSHLHQPQLKVAATSSHCQCFSCHHLRHVVAASASPPREADTLFLIAAHHHYRVPSPRLLLPTVA